MVAKSIPHGVWPPSWRVDDRSQLTGAWRHLAEETVAGLSIPVDQVTKVFGDLGASLNPAAAPGDVPRHPVH